MHKLLEKLVLAWDPVFSLQTTCLFPLLSLIIN